MPQRWFFHVEGETIVLRSRIEDSDIIGDAEHRIDPGDEVEVPGLTYEALREADAGVLEIAEDGKSFTITPPNARSA